MLAETQNQPEVDFTRDVRFGFLSLAFFAQIEPTTPSWKKKSFRLEVDKKQMAQKSAKIVLKIRGN